jgi:hypothetical protein
LGTSANHQGISTSYAKNFKRLLECGDISVCNDRDRYRVFYGCDCFVLGLSFKSAGSRSSVNGERLHTTQFRYPRNGNAVPLLRVPSRAHLLFSRGSPC